MHVFTASVGVPLRPYILWLRLQVACGEMMRGASIAGAAQRAGFSDAAHLNRTLRRMMGMTPGELMHRRAATRAAFASSD
jgi:AraC-like DNA-binding protein